MGARRRGEGQAGEVAVEVAEGRACRAWVRVRARVRVRASFRVRVRASVRARARVRARKARLESR